MFSLRMWSPSLPEAVSRNPEITIISLNGAPGVRIEDDAEPAR